MDLTTQLFWNTYAEQLCDRAAFDSIDPEEEMICYLNEAVDVLMTTLDQKSSRFNLYSLGSIIPDWSSSYTKIEYLLGSYGVFLKYLRLYDSPDPGLPKEIRSAASKFNTAHAVYWKVDAEYKKRWLKKKTEVPMITRDQFDKEYGHYYRIVSDYYEETTRQYISLVKQKAYLEHLYMLKNFARISSFSGGACCLKGNDTLSVSEMYSPIGVNCSDPAMEELLQNGNKASTLELFVPSFNIPELDFIFNAWLEDVENKQTSVDPIDIGLENSIKKNNWGDSIMSLCPLEPGCFLSVISSDGKGRLSSKSTFERENFNIRIKFSGLFSFFMQSSGWFNKGFCQDCNNTKWVFCPELEADIPENMDSVMYGHNPRLFGENGSLIAMPEKLIMGYKPVIELKLNEYDYKEIKEIFEFSECVIIKCGPFTIESMSGAENNKDNEVRFEDDNKIIIKPLSSQKPMILGIICRKV